MKDKQILAVAVLACVAIVAYVAFAGVPSRPEYFQDGKGGCEYGACPDPTLAATHPCLNKKKSHCCSPALMAKVCAAIPKAKPSKSKSPTATTVSVTIAPTQKP